MIKVTVRKGEGGALIMRIPPMGNFLDSRERGTSWTYILHRINDKLVEVARFSELLFSNDEESSDEIVEGESYIESGKGHLIALGKVFQVSLRPAQGWKEPITIN